MNNSQNQDPLTHEIIGAAKEVHRALGTRLLEELYEDAFCIELEERKLKYQRQRHIYVVYKGRDIGDMVADNAVIVELKAVESPNQILFAQLMAYMKLMNLRKGTAHQLQWSISEGRYQAHSPLVHSLCALCASVVNLPPHCFGT